MTKKLKRIFTPLPARFIKMRIRRQLSELPKAGLSDNWKHQAELRVTL